MAQVLKRAALQPSAASKVNLSEVRSSLDDYSAHVRNVYSYANRAQKTGSRTAQRRDQREVSSIATVSRTEADVEEVTPEQVIIISSDGAIPDSDSDESDVWVDAFEYQDQMLLHAPLSQASNDSAKQTKNVYTHATCDNQTSAADNGDVKRKWVEAGSDLPLPEQHPPLDRFARTTRQYADIPLPRKHQPLRKEEYFTMSNNPTKHGGPPTVIYVTNEKQLNSVIGLLKGPILSLDMEWIAWTRQKNISLIQLSDAFTILLIQICQFPSFPAKLKQIIEDPTWVKCGVAIMGADASRLRDVYNVWPKGICELSFFARLIDRAEHGPKNTLIKLSDLAHRYLGAHLAKGDVRCSDWAQQPLTSEQRHYASVDAYAGYLIFAELERRRQSDPKLKDIWPPISACPPRPEIRAAGRLGNKPSSNKTSSRSNTASSKMTEVRQVIDKFRYDGKRPASTARFGKENVQFEQETQIEADAFESVVRSKNNNKMRQSKSTIPVPARSVRRF